MGTKVRIYVTAPPVDGKANTAAIKQPVKALGVAKSHITIRQGERGRNKVIVVEGMDYVRQRCTNQGCLDGLDAAQDVLNDWANDV